MQKTRKSMVYTGLTILACIAMLVAATFAWFTDSVTNKGNKIAAGELKISATAAPTGEDGLTVTIPGVNGDQPITFSQTEQDLKADSNPIIDDANWEPGKSNAKLLTVTNAGTLNTKIKLNFNITNDELTDALWFDFVQVNPADNTVIGQFTKRPMSTLESYAESLEFNLPAGQSAASTLKFMLVYGMDETAGNAFGGKAFGADVSILATQAVGEQDGFGHDDYDQDADYAWDGMSDESGLEENTDDEAKTVTIGTAGQLAALADKVNSGTTYQNYTVTLNGDVNLSGQNWTPIGTSGKPFSGTFDGNNHVVRNVAINAVGQNNIGFFGNTTGGEIKNLTVENAAVKGYLDVGVVAGQPYTSKYTNIKVTGTVKVEGFSYVGGVFGKNAYNDLTNITVDVSADSYVKANSVDETGAYRAYVGGVVGFMGEGNITVSNVTSNIDVYGTTCDVGGITGIAHYGNTFENCTSSGDVYLTTSDVEGKTEIGGIAGTWMNSKSGNVTLRDCAFTGTLHATFNGQDISGDIQGNTLTGSKYYPNSNEGNLIIK